MRGTIIDMVPLMIITFVLLVGLVAGSLLYSEFRTEDFWDPTYTGDIDQVFSIFDYGAIFIVVALGLGVVVSAFFIRSHPIFLPISIIIFIVVVLISGVLTNAFMGYASDTSISSHANVFSNYLQFLGYVPYIVVGFGAIVLIAIYAKPGSA